MRTPLAIGLAAAAAAAVFTAAANGDAECTAGDASSDMLVGTSLHREAGETYADAYQRRVEDWQAAPEIVRFFYSGLPHGQWPTFGSATSVVSFKAPDMDALLAGRYDQPIRQYFERIPDDHEDRFVAFFHEPEDDIERGAFTAEQFRGGYARLTEIVSNVNERRQTDIQLGVILMGWTTNPSSGRDVNAYIPSSGVDFLGWDVYPGTSEDEIEADFDRLADVSDALNISKVLITETAPSEDTTQASRADWISSAFDTARSHGFDAVMYFDSTQGGDFRLTGPPAWAAMREQICR